MPIGILQMGRNLRWPALCLISFGIPHKKTDPGSHSVFPSPAALTSHGNFQDMEIL
ncbi:unnamed protein product, partial [Gulo gulo]